MTGYGEVAVKAAQRIIKSGADPEYAWKQAVREVFPAESSSLDKGCPRGAFLGLCKRGAIEDVRGFYELKDTKNGDYACRAWNALKREPELAFDRAALWSEVHADATNENGQLDVVLALWDVGLLKGSRT
jgi:hypothetical protein